MMYTDDGQEEGTKWYSSLGQAAALVAKGHTLTGIRLNRNPKKAGQVQYGFADGSELVADAEAYFQNNLLVDALTYWDRMYELRQKKYAVAPATGAGDKAY